MENRYKAAHSFLLKQSKANQHIALNKLLKSIDITSLNRKDNKQAFYLFLIKTIVSQQVSTSAAKTIWNKLENILETKEDNVSIKDLRSAGVSKTKAGYILGIIRNKSLRKETPQSLQKYSPSDLSDLLIQIKGIGPWTIGIVRMFYINDEDVWLEGDLGINKSINIFLPKISHKEIEMIYTPYRTFLSLCLWRGLDSN